MFLNRGRLVLLFLLFSIFSITLSAQCPIQTGCGSLAVSGGFPMGSPTFFCEGEVVLIENSTDPTQVDTTIVDWGDGQIEIFDTELMYNHTYDFAEDTCLINSEALVFTIQVTVINNCEDGMQSVNCFNTFVQIKVDPVAIFESSNEYCVGEEVDFQNESCENGSEITYSWDFGDGSMPSDEESPTHTYNTAGTYTVAMTITNECGSDTQMRTITVIEPAELGGIALDGAIISDEPLVICLEDNPILCLNGDLFSTNETSYLWRVLQSASNYNWIIPEPATTPTVPELKIEFFNTGLFDIVLAVDNGCEIPVLDTLTVQVVSGDFSLENQPDGCVSLDYTPSPLEDNAVYTINGMPASNFPLPLGPGEYIVQASGASSICNSGSLADTFLVLTQEIATILTPDTTLCALDGDFTFEATPENGEWRIDGTLFSGTLDLSTVSPGIHAITYGNEPCITTDEISFTVVGAAIDMPADQALCVDSPPTTFMATPVGGTWSAQAGASITPSGEVNPAMLGVGVYTFYYELINEDLPACSNLDSFQLTIEELSVDFQVVSCAGTNLCFELTGAPTFSSVSWDFGGTGSSSMAAPCHTFPSATSYDVTVTIMNGPCSATTTRTITIEDPPVANFSLAFDPMLCSPLDVTINDASTGSNLLYEWTLNGEIFSTDPNPVLPPLEAMGVEENYEIGLSVRNDCAVDTQAEMLTVRPLPVSNFGSDQNQYCSGDTIPLAVAAIGNPDSYEWFLDDELIATGPTPPIIVPITAEVDTITICLVTTNECGTDTMCLNLEIIPTDVEAFFNTDPIVICVGDSIRFSNFSTLGVAVFYDFGDGNSTSNPNPTYSYTAPGTYLVVQTAFGCGSDTFEKLITVIEGPTASWDNPGFACPGVALPFENTSTNVMAYEWDFGDGSLPSQEESPQHSYTSPGLYEVCLTVFAAAVDGCTSTLCQTVEIYSQPQAGFMATDSVCLNEAMIFTSTASADVVSCDYQFGDGNGLAVCSPAHTYEAAGLYTVTQIVENANFCPDTFSLQVFVRPLPEPDFTFVLMNGCSPDSIMFNNLSTNADSYNWNFGDGQSSLLTNPTHVYNNPGTYTVTLTAMIDGICMAASSQQITIAETPEAILGLAAPSICAGLPAQFENNSTGAFTNVRWDFGDGSFSFESSPSHTYLTAGQFEVMLMVYNDSLCADTTSITFTVHEALSASATTENVNCNAAAMGSIALDVLTGMMPYSFAWNNGAETPTINNLTAGDYIITITDDNACVWTSSYTINEPPPIVLTAESSIVTCFGGVDGSLSIEIDGGLAPYEISWATGENTAVRDDLSAGEYPLSITDANNCLLEEVVIVNENARLEYLDTIQHISCFGEVDGVIGLDSIWGGVPPYSAQLIGNGLNLGGVNITRFDSLASGNYSLLLEDANGCLEDFDTAIIEPDSIFVNIEEDTILLNLGASQEIVTFYNANEAIFAWSPDIHLSCGDCDRPVATPFFNQQVDVLLTDENGCQARDSVVLLVTVDREVWLPNTFTPNGDLENDIFRVRSRSPESIDSIEVFQIFDRWGEMLFEATDFEANDRQFGWNGRFRDKFVEPGVYVYYARVRYVDQEILTWKGEVLLVR